MQVTSLNIKVNLPNQSNGFGGARSSSSSESMRSSVSSEGRPGRHHTQMLWTRPATREPETHQYAMVNTSLRGSFTKEGPGQPVVSCSKNPGVSVESQEQGGDAGGHAQVLEGIGESSDCWIQFKRDLCRWHWWCLAAYNTPAGAVALVLDWFKN